MSTLNILIVDDSAHEADLIVTALKRARYVPMWTRVDSAGTLTAALDNRRWDVVVCAATMSNLHCLSALHIVRALAPETPFIVVSDALDAADAAEMLRSGATAIVKKYAMQELPSTIARAVGTRAMRA